MAINKEAIDRFLNFHESDPGIKGASLSALETTILRNTGVPYRPHTEPRPCQVEAVALQSMTDRTALFFAPRRGKTKAALDATEHLRRAGLWHWNAKGIVIVPSPLLLHVWQTEIEKHSQLTVDLVRSSRQELDDALASSATLIVIAWSTLQVIFTKKEQLANGRNKLMPDLALLRRYAPKFSLAIIDELHTVGTTTGLRFVIARELLQHCVYRTGLTGTPIGRDPYALWPQFYILDGGRTLGHNEYFFKTAFGKKLRNKFTPSGFEVVFDEKKLPLLQDKIAPVSLTYGLDNFNTEILRGVVDLKMLPEQRKLYRQTLTEALKARKDDTLKKHNVFQTLRQISSGYLSYRDGNLDKHIHEFESAKALWLLDFISSYPKGAKFILFNDFRATGALLSKLLTKNKIKHVRIYGDTTTADANAALEQFTNSDTDWIIANTQKACMGISLHAADYMLFFESPLSSKIRKQAEARPISPARQGRALFIDDFVCSPVEQRIVDLIKEGFDVSENLFNWEKMLDTV